MTPNTEGLGFDPDEDACGLSDEDIRQLLGLVRAHTAEKIISITSVGEDAEIVTGYLANGEAGSGQSFHCVRTGSAWTIKEHGQWMA